MNILNKLTIKHLKMNKKRTIVTIVGVILSTALMVGIGLLFSTIRDYSIKLVIENNGSQHAIINMDYSKINLIKNNNQIKSYDYIYPLGYSNYDGLGENNNYYISVVTTNEKYLKKLKLVEGRLPENENEIVIPKHLLATGVTIKIGDNINLNMGKRYLDEEELTFKDNYIDGESLKNTIHHTYLVVGIIERDPSECYSDPSYMTITKAKVDGNNFSRILVNFKNPKDSYKIGSNLAKALGYKNLCTNIENECYEDIEFNDSLLSLSGATRYGNILDGMIGIITIILSLVSIACIIVIYNSFSISVMERKKQFGLFASIGATRKQLSKTVFFEAFIIAFIGIPLGILSGLLGIGVVLSIINHLLPEIFEIPLSLSVYPLFMIIPVLFMIITIFVSAYIPSKMAAHVSPIIAIRQNDDIKIKNKKLKTPKFITKIFGVEGELALKNMKRNKKKYRVTIISLFISIVLFISFSGFTKYSLDTAIDMTDVPDSDIQIYAYNINGNEKLNKEYYLSSIKQVLTNEDVFDSLTVVRISNLYVKKFNDEFYDKSFLNVIKPNEIQGGDETFGSGYLNAFITVLENDDYKEYQKQLGLKEDKVIVINKNNYTSYENGNRKKMKFIPYSGEQIDLQLYGISEIYDELKDSWSIEPKEIGLPLKNLYYTEKEPKYLNLNSNEHSISLVMSEDMIKNYAINEGKELYNDITTFIKSPSYKNVWPVIQKIEEDMEDNEHIRIYAYNVKEELKLVNNMIIVIKILLYGFITLVTLIGVTSVFNTINTSIALRRKEFSMLRSMGLTPKGFNKILYFESLFFGLKSLIYAIPVSLVVIYLLHCSFDTMVSFNTLMIPWKSILQATIGVFVIVLCTMYYASSKIKRENILEALREENI